MLYDLNIPWSPTTTQDDLLRSLALATSFGYKTVALSHTIDYSETTPPKPAFPPARPSSSTPLPNVLHRATMLLAESSTTNYRLQALIKMYDILAVRPLTKEAFQHACLALEVPIISLDLAASHSYLFQPKPCMAAVKRGVRFEICYGQALNADARGRALFIGNVKSLIRVTRGRGFIISSEAKTALGLRAPADVANLLNVWGLPNDKGMEGLGSVPRSVVVNEGIKRNGFRGVINVVKVIEQPKDGGHEKSIDSKAAGGSGNGKRKMEQDGGQNSAKGQNKKTKVASRRAVHDNKG